MKRAKVTAPVVGPVDAETARMLDAAATKAADLERQAKTVRAAAKKIATIVAKRNRSERADGAAWEIAEGVLKGAGIPVPNSAFLSWSE